MSSSSSVQFSSDSISADKLIILQNIKCPQQSKLKHNSGMEPKFNQWQKKTKSKKLWEKPGSVRGPDKRTRCGLIPGCISFTIFHLDPSAWGLGYIAPAFVGRQLKLEIGSVQKIVVFTEDLCRWLACQRGLRKGSDHTARLVVICSSDLGQLWSSAGAGPPSGLDTDRTRLPTVTFITTQSISP